MRDIALQIAMPERNLSKIHHNQNPRSLEAAENTKSS